MVLHATGVVAPAEVHVSTQKSSDGSGGRAEEPGPPVNHPFRVRDLSSPVFVEIWLVAAVTTILVTRLYLAITDYPQVGGDTLHIAHMLWGGLAMVIAFGMLLIMASAVWKPTAALVGGFGFGMFIDELGKFITKDNDYFYRPTIGLIYAVLMVLFLISRSIDRFDKLQPGERVLYATQYLDQYAIGHLDEDGRQAGLRHLELSGIDTDFTRALRSTLEGLHLDGGVRQSRLVEWRNRLAGRYWKLVGNPWLLRLVFIVFGIQVVNWTASLWLAVNDGNFSIMDGLNFGEIGTLLSGFVAGAISVYGLIRLLQGQRLSALKWLAAATLVNLFFGQFFAFAANQFAALGSLLLQLMILGALRFGITAEEHTSPDGSEPDLPLAELQAITDTGGSRSSAG
jgi:hypothetical protein